MRIIAMRRYAQTYAVIEAPGSKPADAAALPFAAEYAENRLAQMRGTL